MSLSSLPYKLSDIAYASSSTHVLLAGGGEHSNTNTYISNSVISYNSYGTKKNADNLVQNTEAAAGTPVGQDPTYFLIAGGNNSSSILTNCTAYCYVSKVYYVK